MRRGGSPEGVPFAVDMGQTNDIAKQTISSVLLAVGPEVAGVTMATVPAQLKIGRFGTDVSECHIHTDMVSRLGRSLADLLVDDVIGLWTGDPRLDALSKAASGSGDGDSIIVDVEVATLSIMNSVTQTVACFEYERPRLCRQRHAGLSSSNGSYPMVGA